ncbi:MAG: hypothetical protein LLF94_10840 [Chlamydiales bacterium]|nr:hypothetical protein [Chlamydiales bacterium]
MANGFFSYYKELPQWAKGVVVIGGAVVVGLIGISVVRKLRGVSDIAKAKRQLRNTNNDLKALEQTGLRGSFPKSQYSAWASQLHTQFGGCDFSATFYSSRLPFASSSFIMLANIVKQLKNDVDWLSLVSEYGVKTYDQCGIGTGDFTGDLYAAISDELTAQETAELNKLLQERKISYRVT